MSLICSGNAENLRVTRDQFMAINIVCSGVTLHASVDLCSKGLCLVVKN